MLCAKVEKINFVSIIKKKMRLIVCLITVHIFLFKVKSVNRKKLKKFFLVEKYKKTHEN